MARRTHGTDVVVESVERVTSARAASTVRWVVCF